MWRLTLLGRFGIERPDGMPLRLGRAGTGKSARLLAYLACHQDRPVPGKELIEQFWANDPNSAHNLIQSVATLRDRFQQDGLGAEEAILTDRQGYRRLNPALFTTDLAQFHTLLEGAQRAADDATRSRLLAAAVDHYHPERPGGAFLCEMSDAWVEQQREQLLDRCCDALKELLALLTRSGEKGPVKCYQARLANLERLRREAPLSAPKAAPRPRTGNLPPPVSPFIGRERELPQLYRGLLAGFSAAPEAADDEELPPAVPPEPGGTRGPIVLMGPPGIGKTALALQVADRLRPEFTGGGWWASFSAPVEAEGFLETVRQALALPAAASGDPLALLIERFSVAPSLLVVDGGEYLGPRARQTLERLLRSVPHLTTLATSRHYLDVAGAQVFRVGPLAVPATGAGLPSVDGASEQRAALARLRECESVRLFVHGARRSFEQRGVGRDYWFRITPRNAPDVAALCQHLEGNPLQITLTAARAVDMTPKQMLTGMTARSPAASRPPDAPRDLRLHEVIRWSYALLPGALQRAFRALARCEGGWNAAAATALLGLRGGDAEQQAAELLLQLMLRSLVEVADGGEERRWRLLDALREFGQTELERHAEGEGVARRHAAHFLNLARDAAGPLQGPEQEAWLERLRWEHANLRLALDWARDRDPERAITAVEALTPYWSSGGHGAEMDLWLEQFLRDATAITETQQARVLVIAGRMASSQGQHDRTRALLTDAVAHCRAVGDEEAEMRALAQLGSVTLHQGDTRAASACFRESLTLLRRRYPWSRRKAEPVPHWADLLDGMATLAVQQTRYRKALSRYRRGLRLRQEAGAPRGIARSLQCLAMVQIPRGQFAEAAACLEEARAIFARVGDPYGLATAVQSLGQIALWQGDIATARGYYAESRAIHASVGYRRGIALADMRLGFAAYWEGDYPTARAFLERALASQEERGEHRESAISRCFLANVECAIGDLESAQKGYAAALAVFRAIGDRAVTLNCLEGLARIALHRHDAERAIRLWAAASAWRCRLDTPPLPVARRERRLLLRRLAQALPREIRRRLWASGSALSLEQAVAEALVEDGRTRAIAS